MKEHTQPKAPGKDIKVDVDSWTNGVVLESSKAKKEFRGTETMDIRLVIKGGDNYLHGGGSARVLLNSLKIEGTDLLVELRIGAGPGTKESILPLTKIK